MKRNLLKAFATSMAVLLASSVAFAADNTPGTFLVAPKFDIRGGRTTQIRLVNASPLPVNVKLNYVCPGVKNVNEFCAALDRLVEFTPYQTRIVDVGDQRPPCEQGYVVAFAVDPATPLNQPISWNNLYGSYHLIDGRRHEADNLITIQSPQAQGAAISTNGEAFALDGATDLIALSRDLMTDFRATSADEGSRVVLLDLNILAGMQNPPSVGFIDFWNAAEEPFSSSVEFICWAEYALEDISLNFIEGNLGSSYGSMNIEPRATCPIPGTCPNNPLHQPGLLGSIEEYGNGTRASRTLHHGVTPVAGVVYQSR